MLVCGLLDVLVPVLGLAVLVLPLPAFDALLPDELPEPLAAVLLWLPAEVDELPCAAGCDVVLSASALSASATCAASCCSLSSVLSASSACAVVWVVSFLSAASSAAVELPPQAARLPHSASASSNAVHFFMFLYPPVYFCVVLLIRRMPPGFGSRNPADI